VAFVELTLAEARDLWLARGVPPEICDWLLWEPHGDGDADPGDCVSPDYERVMGRPGRTYARWVDDHLDAFR